MARHFCLARSAQTLTKWTHPFWVLRFFVLRNEVCLLVSFVVVLVSNSINKTSERNLSMDAVLFCFVFQRVFITDIVISHRTVSDSQWNDDGYGHEVIATKIYIHNISLCEIRIRWGVGFSEVAFARLNKLLLSFTCQIANPNLFSAAIQIIQFFSDFFIRILKITAETDSSGKC